MDSAALFHLLDNGSFGIQGVAEMDRLGRRFADALSGII